MSAHASAPIALLTPTGGTITVVHGRKNVCLAVRSAHGIASLDFTEIGRDQLLTALLNWRYVEDEFPDDETRIMLAVDHPDTSEPVVGFHANDHWWDDEGFPIPYVYAWAHIPGLPPKRSAAPGAPSTLKPLRLQPHKKGGAS